MSKQVELEPQDTSLGENKQAAPLAGIRVLDFSHILAGPFCTRLLADLGADVARVETIIRPDHLGERKAGPDSKGLPDRPPSYLNINRSKQSITINLKTEAGRKLVTRLATVADVIVENFSAGVMARLQLDYERLRSLNPRLIYVSMSGYGHNGPRRDWTSMNMNLQAYTGLMMTTGAENDPPVAISNSWNDYMGGFHACFGILQILAERNKTGVGANLDLSQCESSVATLGALMVHSAVNRTLPQRLGSRSTRVAPQGSIAAPVPTSGAPSAFRMTNNGVLWSASWAIPSGRLTHGLRQCWDDSERTTRSMLKSRRGPADSRTSRWKVVCNPRG